MISTSFVVLHAGQSVTLVEYLLRVLVYLLWFAGIGVAFFWGFRVIGIVRSGLHARERGNDSGP